MPDEDAGTGQAVVVLVDAGNDAQAFFGGQFAVGVELHALARLIAAEGDAVAVEVFLTVFQQEILGK